MTATRRIVAFLIALGVFALDRWSKWMVETQFGAFDTKTVIPGLLQHRALGESRRRVRNLRRKHFAHRAPRS